jgi:hypothetical protein
MVDNSSKRTSEIYGKGDGSSRSRYIDSDYIDARESNTKKTSSETPLLYIDINLGEDRSERIVVYEGDSARQLASKFCEEHGKHLN